MGPKDRNPDQVNWRDGQWNGEPTTHISEIYNDQGHTSYDISGNTGEVIPDSVHTTIHNDRKNRFPGEIDFGW